MEHNGKQGESDIKDRVLGRIRSGELSMHTHVYFALKVAALVALVLAALAVSVLLFTFILFTIRVNVHDPLMQMGPRTVFFFLHFFPWHLLLLDVALIALIEWMLKRFRFAYRNPTLYLLLILVAFVLAFALFIDRQTGFNDEMFRRAHQHRLPSPINEMYEGAPRPELLEI